jgi:hypothetical protein
MGDCQARFCERLGLKRSCLLDCSINKRIPPLSVVLADESSLIQAMSFQIPTSPPSVPLFSQAMSRPAVFKNLRKSNGRTRRAMEISNDFLRNTHSYVRDINQCACCEALCARCDGTCSFCNRLRRKTIYKPNTLVIILTAFKLFTRSAIFIKIICYLFSLFQSCNKLPPGFLSITTLLN